MSETTSSGAEASEAQADLRQQQRAEAPAPGRSEVTHTFVPEAARGQDTNLLLPAEATAAITASVGDPSAEWPHPDRGGMAWGPEPHGNSGSSPPGACHRTNPKPLRVHPFLTGLLCFGPVGERLSYESAHPGGLGEL